MIEPPGQLRAALDELVARHGLRRLGVAADRLGADYRAAGAPGAALSTLDTAAYAVYRMPATYAAARAALAHMRAADPAFAPRSVLDLGAGTGAALLAAADAFGPGLELRAVERDVAMRAVGRQLVPAAEWLDADLRDPLPPADLVIAGYALGEHREPGAPIPDWLVAAETVLVVEPGTPRGYRTILDVRAALIAAGMRVSAPCPQSGPCPLTGRDWCHFSVRLPRSAALRQMKGAELSYEDEKFAFVAATRRPVAVAASGRILRHPQRHGGHVGLRFCRSDATVADVVVSKRDRDLYRAARKAGWGDPWPPATFS